MIDYEQYPSPCYVMYEEALEANLQLLDLVQKEANVSIICALKGFSFWNAFPMLRQYLSGATASSLNEARLIAEEMGCEAHTYAPVYMEEEWNDLMRFSSHITFNSLTQWAKYKQSVQAFPKRISCGLRVNPEYSEITTDL